jgi:DNA-binding winged helix-turn-helix (wHTH) protein
VKRFAGFSFDSANECVWRNEKRCPLAPKAYAVLAYLVEHPDRLVPKEELLDAVWPNTFVQEAVLKTCILEIRKALGENSRTPRHIATVHRRGYRFLSVPEKNGIEVAESKEIASALFGRDVELEQLHDLIQRAAGGERQIVFVTGEPGIGKSALVAQFLSESIAGLPVQVLKGECIEHLASREAYYPIFHALSAATKTGTLPGGIEVLRKYAPTWLADMPGLVSDDDAFTLRKESLGASRERMVREMTHALEAMSVENPLIVVLEDLHWSDVSTLDLISSVANGAEGARLLIIGTYRPVDVILSNHPVKRVKQSLLARGRCVELELEALEKRSVGELIDRRFPDHEFPPAFIDVVYDRTNGNPLFVLNVLDYAVSRGLISQADGIWRLSSQVGEKDLGVPESISHMIETQIERLTAEEQNILETASVVGLRFAVRLLGGDQAEDGLVLEECCDRLSKRSLFIGATGLMELGPGCVSASYEFTHSLYRDILYRRLSAARKMRLHRTIGEQIEKVFAGRLHEVAGELARHFETCRESLRAIQCLRILAHTSARRHALREGLDALHHALQLGRHLPEPDRSMIELELVDQIGLYYRLMGQLSSAASAFEELFARALLAGDSETQLRAQLSLAGVTSWSDRSRCLRAVDMAAALAGSRVTPESSVSASGHIAYWNLLFHGWREEDARASAAGLELARGGPDRAGLALHATRHAFFLALSSQYRRAAETAAEGARVGTEGEILIDYSIAYYFEAWAQLHLGEWGRLRRLLKSCVETAKQNSHGYWALVFGLLEAFLYIETFAFSAARKACQDYLVTAREIGHPLSVQISLVLLGLAELGSGDLAAARQNFEEARGWQRRERILMDWIWKLPLQLGFAELCLASGDAPAARAEAEAFLAHAATTSERTWIARAHDVRARIALAERDKPTARRHIALGIAEMDGYEVPLAEWRLHALASQVNKEPGEGDKAREVILRLAGSLDDEPELRDTFLSFPLVAGNLEASRAASR